MHWLEYGAQSVPKKGLSALWATVRLGYPAMDKDGPAARVARKPWLSANVPG